MSQDNEKKEYESEDESDEDYKPDGEGGNVSEEENSGDEESGGEEETTPAPASKRRRTAEAESDRKIDKAASPALDVAAIWADFKKETAPTAPKPAAETAPKLAPARAPPSAGRSGGALAGILGKINKKDKLSVLEKSRLDWNNFKKAEGIQEDLQAHNKGKDGFLEKRDFLERTDLRQFEIEKSLRSVKRSNR